MPGLWVRPGPWPRRRLGLTADAGLGAAALASVAVRSFPNARRAAPLEDYGEAPAFGLTDQLGRPVTSDALRGKVVMADFIYTSCRETCPILSQRMRALQDRLRGEPSLGERVQLLSFSVDPARDTPGVLSDYAERHGADPDSWRFLTGPERYVTALVVQGFKLGVQAVPLGGSAEAAYDVMHSNRIVLIDPRWRIHAYYDGLQLEVERAVADARSLMRSYYGR